VAVAAVPFQATLPIPRVLSDSHIRIPIREAEAQILPGRKTKLWTYGGTFPGPTIRRRAGQRTTVTFEHELPAAGELSVHLHGGHNKSRFDGQPGGLTNSQPISYFCRIPRGLSPRESGNDLLIPPGGSKTYVYDLTEDGHPERAAFQWYHDHRLDRTAPHSWRGLAGMWIVDDSFEDSLPLPRGERDIPLMIADRNFDRRNQLTDPFNGRRPPADGISARSILVNGAFMPHHVVDARRYRLRILNVSQFRSYNLQLSDGAAMVQIGSDSGLMPRPIRRREILIGPAERAEVIVDFAERRGESVELRSGPHAGRNPDGARSYAGALMQFRVRPGRVPDGTRVPRRLRPLPEWTREARRKPDKRWEIAIGGLFETTWLLNGRTFNPARSDAFPQLGTTETWESTTAPRWPT
jgi:spore coat protein A